MKYNYNVMYGPSEQLWNIKLYIKGGICFINVYLASSERDDKFPWKSGIKTPFCGNFIFDVFWGS